MRLLSNPNIDLDGLMQETAERERRVEEAMQAITKLLAKERDLLDMMGATPKPGASPTAAILDAAEAVLREAGDAGLSSSVIWEKLEEQGVCVGGKNPAANLSAKLSQAKGRFVSGGPTFGWRLASKAETKPKGLNIPPPRLNRGENERTDSHP